MDRHPALAPLSRDHHRALVEARAARLAAGGDPPARIAAGRRFAAFFAEHAVAPFRSEEEDLFPLIAPAGDGEMPEPLARALLEHARLHALARRIRDGVARGAVDGGDLDAAGTLLHDHVRLEERVLFPLIERDAGDEGLVALRLHDAREEPPGDPVVADLRSPAGSGVVWSATSRDLNVNLATWAAGAGVGGHVNAERDVLLVVLEGAGTVVVDGRAHALHAGSAAVVPAGSAREVRAGPAGIRYLSVHRRRPRGITLG
ncbi:MAG TPA: hemerythrin domain-containing protein [Miltoncostaea sp.]|nr:hemerythrin domain-containing protein [Miltoncostaea sp.]